MLYAFLVLARLTTVGTDSSPSCQCLLPPPGELQANVALAAEPSEPASVPADESPIEPGMFDWPTQCREVSSGFRSRQRRKRPHQGIDIRENLGARIVAAAPGRVTFAGRATGYGLVVKIDHGAGVESRYAHASRMLVKTGDRVVRGQPIARVGTSGNARGPHCHFEIRVGGEPVDPLVSLSDTRPEPLVPTSSVAQVWREWRDTRGEVAATSSWRAPGPSAP